MKRPPKVYRYRPLEDALLDREVESLRHSYLYAPPFAAMNDPMEAFYETGGPGDRIINAMLAPTNKRIGGMYEMLSEMTAAPGPGRARRAAPRRRDAGMRAGR
jgi:hypothetical protein